MHAGMITREDELTVGRELWHVYGHLDRTASKVVVLSEVRETEDGTYRYVRVANHLTSYDFAYEGNMFLGDVGIGTNHNMNRLFETMEQALAFYDSEECADYRAVDRRIYDDYDDYPLYEEEDR